MRLKYRRRRMAMLRKKEKMQGRTLHLFPLQSTWDLQTLPRLDIHGYFFCRRCDDLTSTKIFLHFLSFEWNMIVVTLFLFIMNSTEFHFAYNKMENCHYNHIPFIMKGIVNIFLFFYVRRKLLANWYLPAML